MRLQGGQYGDASTNSYVAAQMQHMSGQRMETNSGSFEGRLEAQMRQMSGQRMETNSGSFHNRLEAQMHQMSGQRMETNSGSLEGRLEAQMRQMSGQRMETNSGSFEGRLEAQMRQMSGQRIETNSGKGRLEAPMHQMSGQRMETNSGNFEDRLEAFTPEREDQDPCSNSNPEGQWRWEKDGSNMPNSMTSRAFYEGQGGDASRSYFQGQRSDPKLAFQNQSSNDARTQSREEDTKAGYERNHSFQSFKGLEQKFLDEILKLAKEQNDAEDSENARHREKINAINALYEEKLAELRAQHASCRDEFLKRESHARQQQYQQNIRDPHPSSGMAPSRNPHSFSPGSASAAVGDVRRGYSADDGYDPYRERARFLGSTRDHGLEPRVPYPGGRVYDTGLRYYN